MLFRLRCNLQSARLSEDRPYLGLDVFGPRAEPIGQGEHESGRVNPRLTSGNGKYGYPPGGALIPRTALDAGSYVLVLSTFDPHSCGFELVVYSHKGAASLERL